MLHNLLRIEVVIIRTNLIIIPILISRIIKIKIMIKIELELEQEVQI